MNFVTKVVSATAIALLSAGASAAMVELDPSISGSASYSRELCSGDACPQLGDLEESLSFDFSVAFLTPGVENATTLFTFTPTTSAHFSAFGWTLTDPNGEELAHGSSDGGVQIPLDAPVGPGGDYWYHVFYTLSPTGIGGPLQSAGVTFTLTTADGAAAARVPEPATLALFAIGMLGIGLARRRHV